MSSKSEEVGSRTDSRSGIRRGGLIAVVLLSAIIGGVVGWMIRVVTEPDSSSLENERVMALVDDFFDAFNSHDSEGMDALLTDDYVFSETMFDPSFPVPLQGDDSRDELISRLDTIYPEAEFQKVPMGSPVVVGEGPWVVSQETLTTSTRPNLTDLKAVVTLVIVDDGGQLKVRMERLVGLFPDAEN